MSAFCGSSAHVPSMVGLSYTEESSSASVGMPSPLLYFPACRGEFKGTPFPSVGVTHVQYALVLDAI